MTPEAIEELKLKRQHRLRDVICECLEGIWRSGVGGEVLKVAMDTVHRLIQRFEAKTLDDVNTAISGDHWVKLKKLVTEIDGELPEPRICRSKVPLEGRGTKRLLETALEALGGSATS